MSLSEDAAGAMATKTGLHIEAMRDVLAAELPDGRTIAQALDETQRLRAEVAQLDAICRWNREHVATVVDEEFGLRIGGMACEHPSLTGDRCDACGWKADR